jgi:S1-C subfamily serine protease
VDPSSLLPIRPALVPRRRGHGLARLGLVTVASTSLLTGGLVILRGGALAASPAATSGPGSPAAASGDSATVEAVARAIAPSVVTIAWGLDGTPPSGVIIDPSGLVLTCRHEASQATDFTVTLQDGREFPAKAAGSDTLTDFGFVQLQGASDLAAAPLGSSSSLQVGQLAIAFGNPGAELPGSVTAGTISALDLTVEVGDQTGTSPETLFHAIQTHGAIGPGNRCGPLVDGKGTVVGIAVAYDASAEGIGFALPIDLAKPIIAQAVAGQPIARPWLGLQYLDIDAQVAKDNDLPVDAGAWLHAPPNADGTSNSPIVAGSPAEKAGLKDGDIITALDGRAIDAAHPLDVLLVERSPGDAVTLTVLRGGETISLNVTLGTRPTDPGQ